MSQKAIQSVPLSHCGEKNTAESPGRRDFLATRVSAVKIKRIKTYRQPAEQKSLYAED
jgi:hypothetical protein